MAITLEGIFFFGVGGFKGTASRWLHIISGLYTALLKFRKKYVISYTVHSDQVRKYETIHSYSEVEKIVLPKGCGGIMKWNILILGWIFTFRLMLVPVAQGKFVVF